MQKDILALNLDDPGLVLKPVFIMKVIKLEYMGGNFEMLLFAFRVKHNTYV